MNAANAEMKVALNLLYLDHIAHGQTIEGIKILFFMDASCVLIDGEEITIVPCNQEGLELLKKTFKAPDIILKLVLNMLKGSI